MVARLPQKPFHPVQIEEELDLRRQITGLEAALSQSSSVGIAPICPADPIDNLASISGAARTTPPVRRYGMITIFLIFDQSSNLPGPTCSYCFSLIINSET
jgi:hypothetical protein